MAALVYPTRLLKLTKTAIEISNRLVGYIYIIPKILFTNKANIIPQKISNLFLSGREARFSAPSGRENEAENQWAALCAAHEMASKMPESQILVYLYDSARTHFIKNS